MTAMTGLKLSVAKCVEHEHSRGVRFVDLQLGLACHETGDRLLSVGGRWDKAEKRYTAGAEFERLVHIQAAQIEAAQWLCDWIVRYEEARTAKAARQPTDRIWQDFGPVYSALFHGGRRAGKSHLACLALVLYALVVPGSVCWAVSPREKETEELRAALAKLMPRSWYRYLKDDLTFYLVNGSQITLRSGYKSGNLKAGGLGMALYNEGQKMDESGFIQLRGAVSDSGALTLITANPPDRPIGRWIEDYVDEVRSGKRRTGRTFFFDWRKNPFIERASLAALAEETDEKTFRREILGEFVPIGDVVFHSWSDRASIRPAPLEADGFRDITRVFTKQRLGRPFEHVVGCDFDKMPHLSGAVFKVFEKTAAAANIGEYADIPIGVPLYWVVDEAIVQLSDEDGLIDALEGIGLDPATTGVIADASGEYQDVARTRGRSSWDWFRARGWRFLFYPDASMKKNPDIVERCKVGNALLKSHADHRRLFSVPENRHINRAMKLWELRHMAPYRKSKWAHACDAVTYPCWRFEGRRRKKTKAEYKSVKRFSRRRMFKGY